MAAVGSISGAAAILVAQIQQNAARQQLHQAQAAQDPQDSILLSATALAALSSVNLDQASQ